MITEHGYRLSKIFIDRLGDLIFDLQTAGFDQVAEALVAVLDQVEDAEKGGEIGHGYRVVQGVREPDGSGTLPEVRCEGVQTLRAARPANRQIQEGSGSLASGQARPRDLRELDEPFASLVRIARLAKSYGLPKKEQRP